MLSRFHIFLVVATLAFELAVTAGHAAVVPKAVLKAVSSEGLDTYGAAVAVSEDTLVVGAPSESRSGSAAKGAAYVYKRSGNDWVFHTRLVPADAARGDGFGAVVALSHETIVVGAYGDDVLGADSGAAFVFFGNGTNWSQQAVLKASNAEAGDLFGWSVAISNHDVIVGAYAEDGDGSTPTNNDRDGSGSAYVFSRTGTSWTQQAYLKAATPGVGDAFGWSVGVSRGRVVVGAPFEDSGSGAEGDNTAVAAGAAYIFARSGADWTQQAYLKAANRDAADAFGHAVALANDSLAVGAPFESSNATGVATTASVDNSAASSGAAYVYLNESSAWNQQAYLKASNSEAGDQFGAVLALSGDLLAVAAAGEDGAVAGVSTVADTGNAASQAGAVYSFLRSGTNWTQADYIKAADVRANDGFGIAVAAFGSHIVAGAAAGETAAAGSGLAHAFGNAAPVTLRQAWRLAYFGSSRNEGSLADDADADGDGVLNLAEYAFGTDPMLSGSGSTFISVDGANVTARGAPTTRTTTSGTSVSFRALFGRRKDWAAAGLTYTVQFSGTLSTWANSTATPTLLASDTGLDAVTVPYPFFVNGTKARFFRVRVTASAP